MIKLLILADDLTGALDSGVQLARKGSKVKVFTEHKRFKFKSDEDADILVVNTESRHVTAQVAYDRIASLLSDEEVKNIPYIYKKTDSALRGNVGAELEAALRSTGSQALYFVPAYPKVGITTRNGIQLVNGIPLSESVVSQDLINPAVESEVVRIIKKQSDVPVYLNPMEPEDGISVFDCISDEEMIKLYEALKTREDFRLLAGCAGLLEAVSRGFDDLGEGLESLLVLCGTTNPVSMEQIDRAEQNGAYVMRVDMAEIMRCVDWEFELAERIERFERESAHNRIRIFSTVLSKIKEKRGKLDGIDVKISEGFGWIAKGLMRTDGHEGLMVIGGDTLLGVMKELNVESIYPKAEIVPGIVVSEFKHHGAPLRLISKSGRFGSEDLFEDIEKILWKEERRKENEQQCETAKVYF